MSSTAPIQSVDAGRMTRADISPSSQVWPCRMSGARPAECRPTYRMRNCPRWFRRSGTLSRAPNWHSISDV